MEIYAGMNKSERNRIIEERCRDYGISPSYDFEGNAGYVPDIEDKSLYIDNCMNPVLKEELENALTEMMGNPQGDDSWLFSS